MKVKLKRYNEHARIPEKAYDKDFCYDVYAVSEEEIAPNVWRYALGWGMQIERGDELFRKEKVGPENINAYQCDYFDMKTCPFNLSIDLRPRSSVWKTGMVLSNCEGTIDEGYINETSAVFYHIMPTMPRYRVGDRVGQIKIGITFPIEFVEVDELDPQERGMNGYGSTGNK